MNPQLPAYWSTTGVDMTQTPDRIVRGIIQKSLAIHSPNLTRRLYATNNVLANLPPMDESRVRQWLREIYPYEFRASACYHNDQNNSLALEEIRYLFQALLNDHVRSEWFSSCMFSPPLAELLALALRNQRDRFILDYYDSYDHDFPHVQLTHHLIWRTVLEHVSYNNKRSNFNQWQVLFYESNLLESRLPYIPSHMDNVITTCLLATMTCHSTAFQAQEYTRPNHHIHMTHYNAPTCIGSMP